MIPPGPSIILMLVSPYVALLPLPVVSALLFVVAWGLIDVTEMRRIWRLEPDQRIPLLVTGIATVTLSLEWAIILGIASAFACKRLMRGHALETHAPEKDE